jgi:hypothetical protein
MRRNTLLEEKDKWPQPEEDRRMSDETVTETPPRCSPKILAHGQRIDVAVPAPVEVTSRRVMQCMLMSPLIERRECEQTRNRTHEIIGPPLR